MPLNVAQKRRQEGHKTMVMTMATHSVSRAVLAGVSENCGTTKTLPVLQSHREWLCLIPTPHGSISGHQVSASSTLV
jgi:hypothetical protein